MTQVVDILCDYMIELIKQPTNELYSKYYNFIYSCCNAGYKTGKETIIMDKVDFLVKMEEALLRASKEVDITVTRTGKLNRFIFAATYPFRKYSEEEKITTINGIIDRCLL